jgi:hypothetical protein
LLDTLTVLGRVAAPAAPLTVRRWPRREWTRVPEVGDERERTLRQLDNEWNQAESWTVAFGDRHVLFWMVSGVQHHLALERSEALLGGRIADGATHHQLAHLAAAERFPVGVIERVVGRLARIFL